MSEIKKLSEPMTQLWALMQAFGPHVFMGMAQPHFVDNIIEKK